MTTLLLACSLCLADPASFRADLGDGASLFIPEGFRPDGGVVDVLFHLHGANAVVEPAVVESRWPGVLVAFNRKGLSKAYAEPFSDKSLFPKILEKAREAAGAKAVGRVVVSSFSAGFGGVRELLKVPDHFDRIDGLVMLDSIYCGYLGDPSRREVDPALMSGFRRFAAEAAAGRKAMLVTHSAQVPEGYASTTETADDLIRSVGGVASESKVDLGDGRIQTRSYSKGKFLVLGFDGVGAADHMRHLRRVDESWRRFLAIR